MDLFTAARVARDEVLRIVEDNRPDWVKRAVEAIRDIAREQATLTSADVWKRVGEPSEPRAMGAAFVKAKAQGIIAPSGLAPVSTERANARKLQRWRSLVYRPRSGYELHGREVKAGVLSRALFRLDAELAGDDPDAPLSERAAQQSPEWWAALAKVARKPPPSDATILRVIEIIRDQERRGGAA